MKANELRIGNFVEFPSKTKYQVDIIYPNHETLIYWKPIQLTEDILLRCGFISDTDKTDNYFVKLKHGNFLFQSDLSVNFREVYLRVNNSDIIVEFLHQLQNLYFTLTNKELIYT